MSDERMPQAVVLRTIHQFAFQHMWEVILTTDGIGWQRPGTDEAGWRGDADDHWLPWRSVGGLSERFVVGGTHSKHVADILGLDGVLLGSIEGTFEVDGGATGLSHVVALFRADLFVEIEGTWKGPGGCIRREVAEAEAAASTNPARPDVSGV
jgi:hypothetical protein